MGAFKHTKRLVKGGFSAGGAPLGAPPINPPIFKQPAHKVPHAALRVGKS